MTDHPKLLAGWRQITKTDTVLVHIRGWQRFWRMIRGKPTVEYRTFTASSYVKGESAILSIGAGPTVMISNGSVPFYVLSQQPIAG